MTPHPPEPTSVPREASPPSSRGRWVRRIVAGTLVVLLLAAAGRLAYESRPLSETERAFAGT